MTSVGGARCTRDGALAFMSQPRGWRADVWRAGSAPTILQRSRGPSPMSPAHPGGHVAERDEVVTGAAKSAGPVGTINVLPHDDESISQLIAPVVSRIDPAGPSLQALVV